MGWGELNKSFLEDRKRVGEYDMWRGYGVWIGYVDRISGVDVWQAYQPARNRGRPPCITITP